MREMLEGLIAGVNARDGSICTRFYTKRYRQTLMGRKDPEALSQCRKEVRGANFQAALVAVERIFIRRTPRDGFAGSVQLVERIGTGGLLRARFEVVRTPSGYRINGGRGRQLDPAASPPGS